MPLSFQGLWEQMEEDRANKSPLMTSGIESQSMQVIRAGEELRGDGQPSFWDDFMNLLSNSDGMAELLGISVDKILSWSSRIKEARDQLQTQNQQSPQPDEDKSVQPTGDSGALNTNEDPGM